MTCLRNIGRPTITAIVNTVICMVIMLPLGYYLAINLNFGVIGLWFSMSLAWFVATVFYCYVLITTNWEDEVIEAEKRNQIK